MASDDPDRLARQLASSLAMPIFIVAEGTLIRVDMLLTHLHLDHIQGLGFFAPL